MLNRHHLIPALIAAALHAALLFGIRYHPTAAVVVPPGKGPPHSTIVPVDFAPPPDGAESDPTVARGERVPSLPELPSPPVLGGPTIAIPAVYRPAAPSGPLHVIPVGWSPIGDEATARPGDKLVVWRDLDRVPRARGQPAPVYPAALRTTGLEGTVLVEFDVDAEGRVTRAVVRAASHCEFEEPTVRAVLRWRFEPGRRNGQIVPFRMRVPVHFRLNEV
jgi:protein TonB